MHNKPLVLLLSIVLCLSPDVFSQTSWEIDKRKDGIIVYTKDVKDSDFKSFKAVMAIDASTDEIVEILRNADDYTKWYGFTRTSELLKQEANVQYNYVETIFPWPYNNRDMVYRMSIEMLPSSVIKLSLTGLPDYIPEKKGIVRMKKAEGHIVLHPFGDTTEVTYVFHSEPGNVPPWLANNSIAELPLKTLLGLREILKESKTGR